MHMLPIILDCKIPFWLFWVRNQAYQLRLSLIWWCGKGQSNYKKLVDSSEVKEILIHVSQIALSPLVQMGGKLNFPLGKFKAYDIGPYQFKIVQEGCGGTHV